MICDTSEFEKMCDDADIFFQRSAPRIASEIIVEAIQSDASKGQDAFGNKYPGYQPSQVAIRNRLGLQTRKVDFNRGGHPSLLETLKRRRINGEDWVTVVEDRMEQAEGLTKGVPKVNLVARDFFQVNEKTEDRIGKEIEKEFKRAIK